MTTEARRPRILIFNVNWLGDVLFSTAVIRNVRYQYPGAYIACVVPPRCQSVLQGNPYLDEIIIFDDKGDHRHILNRLTFIKELRQKKFDIAILLHRSLTRALICRLAGIAKRIGYYTKKRGFLLTTKIIPPARDSLHRIDYYLKVLEGAGLKIKDRHTDFVVGEADRAAVEEFLRKEHLQAHPRLVGINAGGNWGLKRWPPEYWAGLADRLIRECKAAVIITGSKQDIPLAREIAAKMKEKPVVAAGELNLKQLGGLCQRLDVFITADTGPLHIADAVNSRHLIALFGPTSPEITGPRQRPGTVVLHKFATCVIPCYELSCPDNRCMRAISVDDVFKEACRALKEGKA